MTVIVIVLLAYDSSYSAIGLSWWCSCDANLSVDGSSAVRIPVRDTSSCIAMPVILRRGKRKCVTTLLPVLPVTWRVTEVPNSMHFNRRGAGWAVETPQRVATGYFQKDRGLDMQNREKHIRTVYHFLYCNIYKNISWGPKPRRVHHERIFLAGS